MSEGATVKTLEVTLAESSAALAAAVARAEQAEAEGRQYETRTRQLEGARDLYRPQRELLQAITHRVLAGILVLDGEEFRAKWANPACRRMLDEPYRTQVDIAGLRVEEFLPGANEFGLVEMLRQAQNTEQAQSAPETEYAGFARGTTYWRWSIVPLPGGPGTRPDLLLVANELTAELAEANRALHYQATLLANINDAVVATDTQYRITAFNHAAEELYGWKAEDVVGQPVAGVFRSEFVGTSREQARQELIASGQWQGEVLVHRRDGSAIYCDSRSIALTDAAGEIIGYVGVNRDISERKKTELQMEAALAALHASREELRAYARRLVEAIENERRNLARELHDQAGQSMAALKLSLGFLRRAVDGQGQHTARFDEMGQLVDGVMDDLHHLAVNLRPVSLDRYGLLPALQQYVDFYRQQSGLIVDLVAVGIEERRLPADIETAVYRVIQEALTNVVRHARAKRVSLVLQRDEGRVLAIVEDDGQGFDVAEALCCGRLGLLGMRERAEMFGGTLTIESKPGKGAAVFVQLPLVI